MKTYPKQPKWMQQAKQRAAEAAAQLAAKLGADAKTECPGCGSEGPHETNGDALDPQAWCTNCDLSFNVEVRS